MAASVALLLRRSVKERDIRVPSIVTRWLLKYAVVRMPQSVRRFAQALLRRFGLALHRWPSTRFDAMADALALLRRAGFRPDVVVDVGANRGQWTAIARAHFPDAVYHLVEPQPGCLAVLKELAVRAPGIHVHGAAVTRPGMTTVFMTGGGERHDGEGNFVSNSPASVPAAIPYPSTTLDALLPVVTGTRVLLKLDVEGHELAVLEGASELLTRAEVVIAEFWIFQLFHEQMTILPELMAWLGTRGFVLYDVASLRGRPRDNRLESGDAVFVRRGSHLLADSSWQ
jgi:FkbM family methyltransferase